MIKLSVNHFHFYALERKEGNDEDDGNDNFRKGSSRQEEGRLWVEHALNRGMEANFSCF